MKAGGKTVFMGIENRIQEKEQIELSYQWGQGIRAPRMMIEELRLRPRKMVRATNTGQGKIKKGKQSEEPSSCFPFLLFTHLGSHLEATCL